MSSMMSPERSMGSRCSTTQISFLLIRMFSSIVISSFLLGLHYCIDPRCANSVESSKFTRNRCIVYITVQRAPSKG